MPTLKVKNNGIWETVSGIGGSGGSGGSGVAVQSDYAQNDSSAVDYIKNRPFYAEITTVFDQDVTAELQEGLMAGYNHPECVIDMSSAKDGDSFVVTVDGHSYSCAMIDGMIGNLYIILEFMAKMYNLTVEQLLAAEPGIAEIYPDTGEPFIIAFNYNVADDGTVNESTTFIFREVGTYHYTIDTGIIHKIDSKFLNTDELLPSVGVNNNGQVLGVVNGKWAATKAASGLPEVTTADNDKVLMVVDGIWIAGSIANGDEVYY